MEGRRNVEKIRKEKKGKRKDVFGVVLSHNIIKESGYFVPFLS